MIRRSKEQGDRHVCMVGMEWQWVNILPKTSIALIIYHV
jgi:hypothetical protein